MDELRDRVGAYGTILKVVIIEIVNIFFILARFAVDIGILVIAREQTANGFLFSRVRSILDRGHHCVDPIQGLLLLLVLVFGARRGTSGLLRV